jgi:hypothetical protein
LYRIVKVALRFDMFFFLKRTISASE